MRDPLKILKRCIIRLAIFASAVLVASCSDNSLDFKGLGTFSTDCTSEDRFEGELEFSIYELDGKRSANVEWYLDDFGGSWSAPDMVLTYDFISFADKKDRGFIKLSRDRPKADDKWASFEGRIIFLSQDLRTTRTFNVQCETGYWD